MNKCICALKVLTDTFRVKEIMGIFVVFILKCSECAQKASFHLLHYSVGKSLVIETPLVVE